MSINEFIRLMPKVELHVHLVGAVSPDLLLRHYRQSGLFFADQLAALNRARSWASATLGIDSGTVIDTQDPNCRVEQPQKQRLA